MTAPIIEARGLGKAYTIAHTQSPRPPYASLRDDIALALSRPFRRGPRSTSEQLWALDDVSFAVERGEVFGIVGRNGAGKSTLLKILSRIVEPTRGEAHLRGRVASLLEVGTGFHPELTGRENVFFNGVLLGMSKREVARKFDEIVAFAEIERFLDTPVKFYSSGMYVRLAFAVAAHLEPDILIVDEVLAVGDASFQRKSLGKMRNATQAEGRTVLFVSHNMGAIEQLCTKVLWLRDGQVADLSDRVAETIGRYLADEGLGGGAAEWRPTAPTRSQGLTPLRLAITDNVGGTLMMPVDRNGEAWLRLEATLDEASPDLILGYAMSVEDGSMLYSAYATDPSDSDEPIFKTGKLIMTTKLPLELLNQGRFKIELIALLHNRGWIFQPGVSAPYVYLQVEGRIGDSSFWGTPRFGSLAPVFPWSIEQ